MTSTISSEREKKSIACYNSTYYFMFTRDKPQVLLVGLVRNIKKAKS